MFRRQNDGLSSPGRVLAFLLLFYLFSVVCPSFLLWLISSGRGKGFECSSRTPRSSSRYRAQWSCHGRRRLLFIPYRKGVHRTYSWIAALCPRRKMSLLPSYWTSSAPPRSSYVASCSSLSSQTVLCTRGRRSCSGTLCTTGDTSTPVCLDSCKEVGGWTQSASSLLLYGLFISWEWQW